MNTQEMLDNAATASQASQLFEPTTRGAVLRSLAQWLRDQKVDQTAHEELIEVLIEELETDLEFNL